MQVSELNEDDLELEGQDIPSWLLTIRTDQGDLTAEGSYLCRRWFSMQWHRVFNTMMRA
jgi:hypothetical protein